MTNQENIIDLKLNTVALKADVKAARRVLTDLDKALTTISQNIREAFSVKGFTDYTETVSRFGKGLADDLLVLQLNFGKLKAAIADAAAPIMASFVPWLDTAIRKATEFAQTAGAVLRLVTGNLMVADSAETAANAQKKLASAGKAARRSLMSIDTIQRLNAGSGGGITQAEPLSPYVPDPVSDRAQAIADKILAILAPLRAIDFGPLHGALGQLQGAFSAMGAVAGESLSHLWYGVLAPFAAWLAETFGPAFTTLWAAAMESAAAVLAPVQAGVTVLFEALKPVVAFVGETVVSVLGLWQAAFQRLGEALAGQGERITGIFSNVGTVLTALWGVASPVLENMRGKFFDTFDRVSGFVSTAVGSILQALHGLTEFLAGAFTGNWKRSWEGVKSVLTGLVNGVIGLLNTLLSRLGSALNAVISAANKLRFTVPDWVPALGGKSFGVNMSPVTVPQIPYLARGAVLPANKPFLAMVGDQRSGTNIEAPLATIQEAVRTEMEGVSAALLAGFEASTGIQREILEAVLGITIGDEVIGQAAQRYNRRQAVITGGAL